MRRTEFNAWWCAVVLWACVIFFSSTLLAFQWCEEAFAFLSQLLFGPAVANRPSYGLVHLLADKGLHVTMFLVLAVLLWNALPRTHFKPWLILGFGLLIGCTSEFLQSFFPGRDPAVRDVLINVAGTALGLAISFAVAKQSHSPDHFVNR